MLSDLKYALRQARKAPGFTVIAILILGIGIGATTVVFTLINAVLIRGLPVRDPSQLVLASSVQTLATNSQVREQFSYSTYALFRDRAQSLAGVMAAGRSGRVLVSAEMGQDQGIPIQSGEVSGNFFSLLGVPAFVGRALVPNDDNQSSPRAVVVLSYGLWQRKFGADPEIAGKTVLLDNTPFAIVGVAPKGFFGVEAGQSVDLWMPLHAATLLDPTAGPNLENPRFANLYIFGRLRPGGQRAIATAELDSIFQGQGADIGIAAGSRARIWGKLVLAPGGSGRMDNRADIQQLLAILGGVVGLVLVISCSNVASLLLARMAVRQRELAVRAALGAARGRLVRQLLAEGLVLSIGGGLFGILAVDWMSNAFASHFAGQAESAIDLSLNGTILLFAFGAAIATGILVGLVPALRFSQIDFASALKNQANTAAGASRQRMNKALVVAQIGVSICLLAGAGLFVRSLQDLKKVDLGFNRENLLLVNLEFDGSDLNRQTDLAKEILVGFNGLPGVRSATLSAGGLTGGFGQIQGRISVEGYTARADENMYVYFADAGPHYFETLGIPLRRGRGFEFADIYPPPGAIKTDPGVVINQAFARKFFGTADPIGRHLGIMSWPHAEIIGVARNAKYANLRDDGDPQIYLPFVPRPVRGLARLTVVVRSVADPHAVIPSVSAAIRRIDPKVRVSSLLTMDDVVDRSLTQERIIAQAASYSGSFALLLACLGLYGLLSYNVAQRTREIGVRLALGARAGNIVSLVVKQAMGLTAIGCVVGLTGAIMLVRLIGSKLYGVTAADPLTLVGTAGLLAVVALVACWLPARRASRVDPMIALRAE